VQRNIAASHLIAISYENTGVMPPPDNSKMLTAVYILGGNISDRRSYINHACNSTFFVGARKPLYIVAGNSDVKTFEPGPGLKAIEAAISVVSAAWPLFTGLPVPAQPATRLSAVKNAEGPIAQFLQAFNNGLTQIEASPLYEGEHKIETSYSTVRVYVTRLNSIVGLNNNRFTVALEDDLSTLFKEQISGTIEATKLKTNCLAAINIMKNSYNLATQDIAYGLSHLAKNGGLTKDQIISCLTRDYALIAAEKYVNSDWEAQQRFTAEDVKSILAETPMVSQPEFKRVAFELHHLMTVMRNYAADSSDRSASALNSRLASPIEAADATGTLANANEKLTNVALVNQLREKGFTKFGCLVPDPGALAMFLAVPEKPAQMPMYKYDEALLFRTWFNSQRQATRMEILFSGNDIKNAVDKNAGTCGHSVTFVKGEAPKEGGQAASR
jgi:hypothetical protein